MLYLSVAGYEKRQHYKTRNPPWVKVYVSEMLDGDDVAYSSLADSVKLQLIHLQLLASRHGNKIPYEPEWLRRRMNINGDLNLRKLLESEHITIFRDGVRLGVEEAAMVLSELRAEKLAARVAPITAGSDDIVFGNDEEDHSPVATARRRVIAAYLEARERHFVRRNGKKPPAINLAADKPLSQLIDKRVKEYGEEIVLKAVCGIFLSTWHTGLDKKADGKRWLDIKLALSVNRQRNNVVTFSGLYDEATEKFGMSVSAWDMLSTGGRKAAGRVGVDSESWRQAEEEDARH